MTRIAKHRLWTASVAIAVVGFLVAATGFACLQREVSTAQRAQDCCVGRCQHAMAAEMAVQCCQGHRGGVSQVLPVVSSSKTVSLAVAALPIAVMPPAVGQTAKQLRVHLSPEGSSSLLPALYTLHCSLLL